jgi:hypothetical protein
MESVLSGREVPESSKLQGLANYALWSFKLRTILQGEKLWRVVDPDLASGTSSFTSRALSSTGHAASTTTNQGAAPQPSPTQTSPPTTSTAAPDLDDLRYRALRMIITSVSDSLLPHVLNISDPRTAWLKLRELYESKSMNRRLSLKSELYSLKMSEKTSIEEHLKAVSILVGQLANIGIAVPDEELVDCVLTSLPSSWKIFRTMTSNRENPISYSELENLMLHKASVRTREQEQDEEAFFVSRPEGGRYPNQRNGRGRSHFRGRRDQANYGRGRFDISTHAPNGSSYAGGAQHRSFRDTNRAGAFQHGRTFESTQMAPRDSVKFGHLQNPKGNCNHCGSPFHWANNCDIRRLEDKIREMETQIGSQKKPIWANSIEDHTSGGNVYPGGPSYNFDGAQQQLPPTTHPVLAAEISPPQYPEEWLIDSGASAHVTGNRNLLTEIRPVPHSSVTTAGGNSLSIVGQGHATLDKNKGVSTVMYVPGMRKNLLSVGKVADASHYTLLDQSAAGFSINTTKKQFS